MAIPTPTFLEELTLQARAYGWEGDYDEIALFVMALHKKAGVPVPCLDPFEEESDAELREAMKAISFFPTFVGERITGEGWWGEPIGSTEFRARGEVQEGLTWGYSSYGWGYQFGVTLPNGQSFTTDVCGLAGQVPVEHHWKQIGERIAEYRKDGRLRGVSEAP